MGFQVGEEGAFEILPVVGVDAGVSVVLEFGEGAKDAFEFEKQEVVVYRQKV